MSQIKDTMPGSQPTETQGKRTAASFYFLFFGAAAALIPFLVILYEQLGLTGSQIGFLIGISPLISWLSAPLWGAAADSTRQHKPLLMLAIAGTIIVVIGLSFSTQFLALTLVIALLSFFLAPIVPIVDNSVLTFLGPQKDQYGKLRVWGAIGWGLMAPLVGWLSERSGMQWIFWGYIAFMLLTLLVSYKLPISERSDQPRFVHEARQLLADRRWFLFLIVIFIGGAGMALISAYLFLYMQSLGGSKALMGLALTVATISEIPFLYYSDRLLAKWGARRLLMLSLVVFAFRALALSLIRTAWLVLPLQLLHGASFAAMWVASVSYADALAPPGLGATAQGLLSGVMFGLGAALGGIAGGLLFAELGGSMMFRWTSVALLLGLILFVLADRRMARAQAPAQNT